MDNKRVMNVCGIIIFISCFMFAPSVMFSQTQNENSPSETIELECVNTTVKDCARSVTSCVILDSLLGSKKLTIKLKAKDQIEALNQMLQAVGAVNFGVQFDNSNQCVKVVSLPGKGVVVNHGTEMEIEESGTDKAGEAAGAPPEPVSYDEIQRMVEKLATPSPLDLDSALDLPGGEMMTIRQLQALEARANMGSIGVDQPLNPPDAGEKVTFRNLQESQKNVDHASSSLKSIKLIDGMTITADQLKAIDEKQIKVGIPLDITTLPSPSSPPGDAQRQ